MICVVFSPPPAPPTLSFLLLLNVSVESVCFFQICYPRMCELWNPGQVLCSSEPMELLGFV